MVHYHMKYSVLLHAGWQHGHEKQCIPCAPDCPLSKLAFLPTTTSIRWVPTHHTTHSTRLLAVLDILSFLCLRLCSELKFGHALKAFNALWLLCTIAL